MSPEGGKMPAPPKEVLELKDDWKKFIDLVPVKLMNREKKAKQIAHLPKGMEKTFANVNLRMGEVRHRLCLLPYPMRHGSDREQTYWPALRFKDEHEVHYFGKCLPEVFGHKAFENRLFAYVVSRALQDDEENNENSVVPPGHAIYRLLGDPDGKFLIIPTTKEKLAFDYVFFWENISPMLKRNIPHNRKRKAEDWFDFNLPDDTDLYYRLRLAYSEWSDLIYICGRSEGGDTYPSYSPFSPIPGLGYREWVGPQRLIKEQNRILAQYTCPSLPERLGLDPLTNNAGELANLMWDIPGLVHLETMKDLKERLESYGWMDYFIQGTSFMVRPKVELENGLLGRDILTFTQVLALVRRKNERWTATYPQGRFNQRKVQTAVGLPPMCLYLPCPFCPQVFRIDQEVQQEYNHSELEFSHVIPWVNMDMQRGQLHHEVGVDAVLDENAPRALSWEMYEHLTPAEARKKTPKGFAKSNWLKRVRGHLLQFHRLPQASLPVIYRPVKDCKDKGPKKPRVAQVQGESKPIVAHGKEWDLLQCDSKPPVDIVVCNRNFGKLESKVAAAEVQCEINSVKLDKDKRHKKPRVAQVQGESKLIVAHGKEWESLQCDSKPPVDIVVCNSNFGKLESKVAAAEVQREINSVKLDTEPADVKLAAHVQYWKDRGISVSVTRHAAPAKVKRNLCADFRAEEI
jgi:hypothetical protein